MRPTGRRTTAAGPRDARTPEPAAPAAAEWEPEVHWDVPSAAVLFDAPWLGNDLELTGHLRVALEPGRYAVRAAHVEPGAEVWIRLVQVRRVAT
ncbi:Imm21 family immunity protein [Streptomyces avermitilis]|uniref:Imm21 family immunity protein n=1 Tax=Streptomyces avermitilis TaxID=33903 RepID=UPI0033B38591